MIFILVQPNLGYIQSSPFMMRFNYMNQPLLNQQPLDFNKLQHSYWTSNLASTRPVTPLDFSFVSHFLTYNSKRYLCFLPHKLHIFTSKRDSTQEVFSHFYLVNIIVYKLNTKVGHS